MDLYRNSLQAFVPALCVRASNVSLLSNSPYLNMNAPMPTMDRLGAQLAVAVGWRLMSLWCYGHKITTSQPLEWVRPLV